MLRQYTHDYIDAKIGTREWRHAYPAIHRELAKDEKAREHIETIYYNQSDGSQDDAQALQSGHTRQTEEMNYGRSTLESPFQTEVERERFRRVSIDWHRIVRFASAWEGWDEDACALAPMQKKQNQRWHALKTADLHQEFRELMGRPDAVLRPQQE